ncbi:hypothetical protein GIB67_007230 [Kingdonia uniflora]|uniref:Uncharacterized protein n=1 Tax=Kingdonia uniflora TaxID=39325 RepID=A0A7J7NX33_9MAGN|nr:hypothetical protein GIB67_007230 [Kingdonia uniflora]
MTQVRGVGHGDPKICKNGDTAVKILFLIFYYAYVGYLTYLTHLWVNLRHIFTTNNKQVPTLMGYINLWVNLRLITNKKQ